MRAAGREKRRRSQQNLVRRKKINGSSKTTTTTMASFPEEVVMEILSWLPIKSVVCFRCVCKIWLKLLTSDPHFIQLHFNHLIKVNPKPSILFLDYKYNHGVRETHTHFAFAEDYESCDKTVELDVPFKHPGHKFFEVSGICNGLLCLINNYDHDKYSNVFIWNPLTRDNIIISCSPIPSYFNQHNNYICSTRFAFGFHHATQEYKVIRVVYTRKVFQSHVSVYTLGTGSWRSLESILDAYGINYIFDDTAELVNGALHFLAARPVSTLILSFDVKDEVFQVISPPNGVSYDNLNAVRLGDLGGLLSLSFTLNDVGIDIWIMQEHGVVNSWTNHFKIKLPGLNTSLKLLAGANNERIIVQRDTFFRNSGGFIVYDSECNLIRKLKKPGFWYRPACVFVGSLASPQVINGVRHITDTGES